MAASSGTPGISSESTIAKEERRQSPFKPWFDAIGLAEPIEFKIRVSLNADATVERFVRWASHGLILTISNLLAEPAFEARCVG